jgi:hypothetical protein
MAIYELWLERPANGKYIAHYDRLPPEKFNSNYSTSPVDSALAAAQELRAELRKFIMANDQFRVRARSNIYENVNDALEDMMRS